MIGVIPAAGYATRLGPLPCSKELLQIGGTPIIDFLLRRMAKGGCSEIRIVTRPEKHDLREYAKRRGIRVLLGHPPHVGASVALGLHGIGPDELVAFGYPDTLWEPSNGFVLLRDGIDKKTDVVLGLFDTADAYRSDVVQLDARQRVTDILIKPAEPPSTLVWGCLVARADALAKVGEVAEVSDVLRPAVAERRVGSRYLSADWLDIGVPAALARARATDMHPS